MFLLYSVIVYLRRPIPTPILIPVLISILILCGILKLAWYPFLPYPYSDPVAFHWGILEQ